MDHLESFRNIAEIGITIVGFSALISLFQKQKEEWEFIDKINLIRFYMMVEMAIIIIMLCYLPINLINYFDAKSTYLISFRVTVILCIAYNIYIHLRNKRLTGKYIITRFHAYFILAIILFVAFDFLNAVGLIKSNLDANYLLQMYILLLMCISLFMRLIYFSIKKPE